MKKWKLLDENKKDTRSKTSINEELPGGPGLRSSSSRTGKGQSSSQFPRREVLKNVLAIGQLLSSPTLGRSRLKSCMLGFSIMRTKTFQMPRLGFAKEEEPEIKLPTFAGS